MLGLIATYFISARINYINFVNLEIIKFIYVYKTGVDEATHGMFEAMDCGQNNQLCCVQTWSVDIVLGDLHMARKSAENENKLKQHKNEEHEDHNDHTWKSPLRARCALLQTLSFLPGIRKYQQLPPRRISSLSLGFLPCVFLTKNALSPHSLTLEQIEYPSQLKPSSSVSFLPPKR